MMKTDEPKNESDNASGTNDLADEGGIESPSEDVEESKPVKKVLVLGNGPSLRDVDFDMVERNASELIVIGINRSHLVYPNHDYMVIQDVEPVVELFDKGLEDEDLAKMKIRTSNYFDRRMKVMSGRSDYSRAEIDRLGRLRREGVVKNLGPRSFRPFNIGSLELAISTCIHEQRSLRRFGGTIRFCLAGVDMKHYPDDNHFYDDDVKKTLRWPREGSNPRQLRRGFRAMKSMVSTGVLKRRGVEVVVCDENSALVKLFPYVSLKSFLDESDISKIACDPDPEVGVTRTRSPAGRRVVLNPRARRRVQRKGQ